MNLSEYAVVRVVKLLTPDRNIEGIEGVARPPRVGDVGTIVHVYEPVFFAVECVDGNGATVWLADFAAEELDHVTRLSD